MSRYIWLSALCSAFVSLATIAPAGPGNPEEIQYRCEFTQECIGTDRPCNQNTQIGAAISKNAQGDWYLWGSGELYIDLMEFAENTADFRSWSSPSVDPDTRSVALLSIAANGQAFLSVHGEFLTPQTVLYAGTCTPEVPE